MVLVALGREKISQKKIIFVDHIIETASNARVSSAIARLLHTTTMIFINTIPLRPVTERYMNPIPFYVLMHLAQLPPPQGLSWTDMPSPAP